MADTYFHKCPSCGSTEMERVHLQASAAPVPAGRSAKAVATRGGSLEYCKVCMFVANYVKFTCGHCNPDVFALCPKQGCKDPGTPTKNLCNAD